MRRKFFACVIVGLSILALGTAREASAQRWDGRVYGGWSNANFHGGSKMLGSEDRNGFIAGAALEYVRLEGEHLGFEFGAAYVQKGAKGTIEPNAVDPVQPPFDSTFEGEAKLDYVELSFIFNFHLLTGERADFRFGIGPALGILASAKAEGNLNGQPAEADLKDYLNNVDFGAVLRAGVAYKMDKITLVLDARSTLGAVSIDDTQLEHDLKTRVFSVLVGIEIPVAQ